MSGTEAGRESLANAAIGWRRGGGGGESGKCWHHLQKYFLKTASIHIFLLNSPLHISVFKKIGKGQTQGQNIPK